MLHALERAEKKAEQKNGADANVTTERLWVWPLLLRRLLGTPDAVSALGTPSKQTDMVTHRRSPSGGAPKESGPPSSSVEPTDSPILVELLPHELLSTIASFLCDADFKAWAVSCQAAAAVADQEAWRIRLVTSFPHSTWRTWSVPSLSHLSASLSTFNDVEPWATIRATGTAPADRGGHATAALFGGGGCIMHGGANGDVLHGDAFALFAHGYGARGEEGAVATADGTSGGRPQAECDEEAAAGPREPQRRPALAWRSLADVTGAPPSPRWAHTATAIDHGLVVIVGGHGGHRGMPQRSTLLTCGDKSPARWQWVHATRAADAPRGPHDEDTEDEPDSTAGRDDAPPEPSVTAGGGDAGFGGRSGGGSEGGAKAGARLLAFEERGEIPMPRYAHAACEHDRRLWLFGGIVGRHPLHATCCNDVVVGTLAGGCNGDARGEARGEAPNLHWCSRTPQGTPPAARFGHSLTRVRETLWTFGGRSILHEAIHGQLRVSCDVHCLRGLGCGEALRWESLAAIGLPPSPRAFHAAVAVGGALIIFGGESGMSVSNHDTEHAIGDIRYLSDLYVLQIPSRGEDETPEEAGENSAKQDLKLAPPSASASASPSRWGQMAWRRLAQATTTTERAGAHASDSAEGALPPPSSLSALVAFDATLVNFGGFNHKPDADMSMLHVVGLGCGPHAPG